MDFDQWFPGDGILCWYGLGNMTNDLPTYVVLPDARGTPAGSTSNWTNGFLPAVHQGVPFRTSGEGNAISNLFPAEEIDKGVESNSRNLLNKLNQIHLDETGANDTSPQDQAMNSLQECNLQFLKY